MIVKHVIPAGEPCTLAECQPGPFINSEAPEVPASVCFKIDWLPNCRFVHVFVGPGEFRQGDQLVQPVQVVYEDSQQSEVPPTFAKQRTKLLKLIAVVMGIGSLVVAAVGCLIWLSVIR